MNENFDAILSNEELKRLEAMAVERPIQAIKELREPTNCSLRDGKIWVDNKREEIWQESHKLWIESLPPCPYCGEKLRTPLAKQCRHCLRDWHDEHELKQLK